MGVSKCLLSRLCRWLLSLEVIQFAYPLYEFGISSLLLSRVQSAQIGDDREDTEYFMVNCEDISPSQIEFT